MSRNKQTQKNPLWIIDGGAYTELKVPIPEADTIKGPIKQYRISDFARYMLSPNPVGVEKRVVGCEIQYRQPESCGLRNSIRRFLPKPLKNIIRDATIAPEEIMAPDTEAAPPLKDPLLEAHFEQIHDALRPYNPFLKRFAHLDPAAIEEVRGICENIDDTRLWLDLKGTIPEKLTYIADVIMKEVTVVLEKAYLSNGLFEMRGFDFTSHDPETSFTMLSYFRDGQREYCVLDANGQSEYRFRNKQLVRYMFLLEQSAQTNPEFAAAFNLCIQGKAKPLVLFFNEQFEIDYTKGRLPKIYQDVLNRHSMALHERNAIVQTLNNHLFGIAFRYIPETASGEEKSLTNICVLHNLAALEPIRNQLPHVYAEIHKQVPSSDTGNFYLLDNMRGYCNEQ
ncbi:MAG: hypothetical protein GY868_08775 [Deltaproteobacteria bacterium]|nr:hypothetical protein [Deltaproteobacteria bacterium]